MVGIAAYFLPFLILMGMYLFVPLYIIQENPHEKSSIWIAFHRSTQLAKLHWGKVAILILINFAIMAAGFFCQSAKDSDNLLIALGYQVILGIMGALYAILVTCQFESLKPELENQL
jgi:hypothetical protein